LHGKKYVFLEDIECSEADLQKETEANNFAIEWTFSRKQEEEVLYAVPLTMERIREFAEKFNTHPAMIIGRFHKKELLHYAEGRQFFVKLEFLDN